MAHIITHSSALHPTALSYLIRNNYLPTEPPAHLYTWQVYEGQFGEENDEIITTDRCVVWSRDGAIQRVIRHEPQHCTVLKAPITAILTDFTNFAPLNESRALCIVAEREIHIYLLSGTSYTVSVPFDIGHAIALPDGLLFARRARRVGQGGTTAGSADLSHLYDPSLFTITDPVAGYCPIKQIPTAAKSRPSLSYDVGLPSAYGEIHQGHTPIYATDVSPRTSLTALLCTIDQSSGVLNVWQTWRIQPKRISAVIALRHNYTVSQTTRRASMHTLTGYNGSSGTPSFRREQETLRGYAAAAQPFHDSVAARRRSRKSRSRPSEESEMDTLSAQLEAHPRPTSKHSNPPRRLSSAATKQEVSVSDPFAPTTAGPPRSVRRGLSTGVARDRQSLNASLRKSRASTLTSMLAPSIEDDSHEMDVDHGQDIQPTAYELERVASMLGPSGNIDFALNTDSSGPDHELIIRKIRALSASVSRLTEEDDLYRGHRVTSIAQRRPSSSPGESGETLLFMLDKAARRLSVFEARESVRETDASSRSTSELESGGLKAALSLHQKEVIGGCLDIIRCRDKCATATICLLADGILRIFADTGVTWSIALTSIAGPSTASNVSLDRVTIALANRLERASADGCFDVCSTDGIKQRFKISLQPRSIELQRLLLILDYVLGRDAHLTSMWTTLMLHLGNHHDADAAQEWEALITAMFLFAIPSLPPDREFSEMLVDNNATNPSLRPAKPKASNWEWLTLEEAGDHSTPIPQVSMHTYIARARSSLQALAINELEWLQDDAQGDKRLNCLQKILLATLMYVEEVKLSNLLSAQSAHLLEYILPACAQIGIWLDLSAWTCETRSCSMARIDGCTWQFDDRKIEASQSAKRLKHVSAPSIFEYFESALDNSEIHDYPTLEAVAQGRFSSTNNSLQSTATISLLPRTSVLRRLAGMLRSTDQNPEIIVEALDECGLAGPELDTYPECIAASCREAVMRCRKNPPLRWSDSLLRYIGREDTIQNFDTGTLQAQSMQVGPQEHTKMIQSVYQAAERPPPLSKTDEIDRHTITHLLFPEDRRFIDARDMTNPMADQIAECPSEPFWTEAQHLEHQKRILHFIVNRTIALPAGDAMILFSSQKLLLSEKLQFPDFKTKCLMRPMNIVRMPDPAGFTEEKTGWAFFHAGVSRGLHISREATGIETSWIAFNKPPELTYRHAGLLFALGLTGRLKTLAKWLIYDYLRSKHTMTSVGLLLGLAASHIGSMDTLVTQTLSLHVMRMLPYGAAPLNVPTIAQTAALMGIGFVYCNTQHRRMTEVMLSELEHRDVEEPGSNLDAVQDESYRLAAGFALGYINLGQGANLRGLGGMSLLERLLALAVGTRPIELIHVIDKAIPAAVIAIALIYMKTGDRSIARKIDIPEAFSQLEHVRPDVLLLRVLAKNLIMWNDIVAEPGWIRNQFSQDFAQRFFDAHGINRRDSPKMRLTSANVPFYNILCGHAWSLSLKYAGSGDMFARDEILACLDLLYGVAKEEAFHYDALLARNTVRRCIDLLALAAATVMAGTGDLQTFRYLRRLHGRVDALTTYGSHMAAHIAIGALFLGGGTFTFGTSNLAIASLVSAFYPMFPADTSDNGAHLQALRHLWVLAAEPRCIIIKDIDSRRTVCIDIEVKQRDGTVTRRRSPCLLPELDTIDWIRTSDPAYWQIKLDISGRSDHLQRFKADQVIFVRQRSAIEADRSLFSSTLTSLNECQSLPMWRQMFQWLYDLECIRVPLNEPDIGLLLGPASQNAIAITSAGTVIDDSLALMKDATGPAWLGLWNVRLLLTRTDTGSLNGRKLEWPGRPVVDALRTEIEKRLAVYRVEVMDV